MNMVDVGQKETTAREAIVTGRVILKPSVVSLVRNNKIPKGNVLEAAKLAGILAAKKTPLIIPLCHPIPIDHIGVEFSFGRNEVRIKTTVRGKARTGVEMEALTATAVAALTVYDMCKPLDKGITISDIQLIKKTGGKSGVYVRAKREKTVYG
ncbi:MAG: cyclic pyranopterin monophosphate synthase MoaC [Candidatus Omnitrophota bacterium]